MTVSGLFTSVHVEIHVTRTYEYVITNKLLMSVYIRASSEFYTREVKVICSQVESHVLASKG